MLPSDYYKARLDCQRTDIRSALLDLHESRRAGWKVLQAELELASRVRSYVRDMADAPADAVAAHTAICVCFT